jgi:hypothetical protein
LSHACLFTSRVKPNPQKKEKKKREWARFGLYAQPTQIMFIKDVFGKTHPYALAIIFMPILV